MPDVADVFTMAIFDAVKVEVPAEPCRHRKRGWCESPDTSAVFTVAWTAREDARKLIRTPPPLEKTAWKTLRTACATLRKVIDLLAANDQRGFYKQLEKTVGTWREKNDKWTNALGMKMVHCHTQGAHS